MIKFKRRGFTDWVYYGRCGLNWSVKIPSLTALSLLFFKYSRVKYSVKIAIGDSK